MTAPHLFRHYAAPLRGVFNEEPGLFAFSDAFDGDSSLFTSENFVPLEPIVPLESDVRNRISEEVGRAVSEFTTIFHREWDDDVEHVRTQVEACLKAMKIRSKGVHVMNRGDMGTLLCRDLPPSEFLESPLFRALNSALGVMENSLKRAVVYKMVNSLLQPVYTASHIGYLRMLYQISRVAGLPDSESYWNRIQGWILSAALSSSITLLRLEVFRRIEPLLRGFIPATTRNIDAVGSRVIKHLDLFRKIHERGPMWLGVEGKTVTVMPAVLIRLDEEGEFHSEDGAAIVDPDGTKVFAVHGKVR